MTLFEVYKGLRFLNVFSLDIKTNKLLFACFLFFAYLTNMIN